MAYIKEYWSEKEKRARQAKKHAEKMEKMYGEMISKSIKNTIIYYPTFECCKIVDDINTEIIVDDVDSVSAVLKYQKSVADRKLAILNFSSYKNPGGGFIRGSKAQEECLCHESFLYNVLSQFKDFYDWNNDHKNKALYINRGLYSPDILFTRENEDSKKEIIRYCDVITCAAPNKSAAKRDQKVSDEENTEVLRSRIKFVLDIAKDNNVDTLILGAYGCGVFEQDAMEVASIFKEYLSTTHKCFEKIVFAIPKGRDKNLEAFEEVFGN